MQISGMVSAQLRESDCEPMVPVSLEWSFTPVIADSHQPCSSLQSDTVQIDYGVSRGMGCQAKKGPSPSSALLRESGSHATTGRVDGLIVFSSYWLIAFALQAPHDP